MSVYFQITSVKRSLPLRHLPPALWQRASFVQCCFTSTETVRTAKDMDARDGHLLSLLSVYSGTKYKTVFGWLSVALRAQKPYGLSGTGVQDGQDGHLDFQTAPELSRPQFLNRLRAKADLNRGPSAYQPNAVPLGPTGSQRALRAQCTRQYLRAQE